MDLTFGHKLKAIAGPLAAMAIIAAPCLAGANQAGDAASAPTSSTAPAHSQLEMLVQEAMERSPAVMALRKHYLAATKVPRQMSTLPDPEVTLQQLTVGGPKPFEGYETSDFYYTGFGVSQEIPWPRKLKLRASQASHEAESAKVSMVAAQRDAAQAVRENYFELYYLGKRVALLEQTRAQLTAIERITEDQYQLGKAQQQDVIKAQFQETSILRELELARLEMGQRQAALKAALGRDIDSANIEAGEVALSTMARERAALTGLAAETSPEVQMAMHDRLKSEDSLALARTDYIPDFSLSYMYQKTGPGMRDYYMLTFGAKIPLYFWRKQRPALEQAALEREAADDRIRTSRLDAAAEVDRDFIAMRTQERMLRIYRDGLIPQAEATRDSAMEAYRTGKVDFQTLLSAVIEVLNANEQYYRAIADHEIAIARIRRVIGEAS